MRDTCAVCEDVLTNPIDREHGLCKECAAKVYGTNYLDQLDAVY